MYETKENGDKKERKNGGPKRKAHRERLVQIFPTFSFDSYIGLQLCPIAILCFFVSNFGHEGIR